MNGFHLKTEVKFVTLLYVERFFLPNFVKLGQRTKP